jgi:FAD dependent oxidoreductase
VAVGLSGVVLICGLDFVAPSTIEAAAAAASSSSKEEDLTFWNHDISSSKHTTRSHRPPLLPQQPSDNNDNKQPMLSYGMVIVGGGMAGLHTALALAERQGHGQNILVVDANRIGDGASGKSKGLVVPGIMVPQDDLARLCGSATIAQQVYDLTQQALTRLRTDIVQQYQIDCDWIDAGMVEASLHNQPTHDDNDDDDDDDDDCQSLNAKQVRQILGQPETSTLYQGGEYDPSCCGVDPLALTLGLAHVLERQWSVRIAEHTKVIKIETLVVNQTEADRANAAPERESSTKRYLVTTETGAQIQCQHGELRERQPAPSAALHHSFLFTFIYVQCLMVRFGFSHVYVSHHYYSDIVHRTRPGFQTTLTKSCKCHHPYLYLDGLHTTSGRSMSFARRNHRSGFVEQ